MKFWFINVFTGFVDVNFNIFWFDFIVNYSINWLIDCEFRKSDSFDANSCIFIIFNTNSCYIFGITNKEIYFVCDYGTTVSYQSCGSEKTL